MLLAALENDGANKPILMESQSIDPKVRAMPNGGPLYMLNTKSCLVVSTVKFAISR